MWLGLLIQGAVAGECPDPGVLARRAERDAAALYLADATREIDAAVEALGCGPLVETELLASLFRTKGWVAALQGNEELAGIYFSASRRMDPDTWTPDFGDEGREMWLAAPKSLGTARLRISGAGGKDKIGFDGQILNDAAFETTAGPHVVQVGDLPASSRYARLVRLPSGSTTDVITSAPDAEKDKETPTLAFALPPPLVRDGGPWTVGFHVGGVVNDPFLTRWMGQVDVGLQPTPHVGVELGGAFAPDLGRTDWKPVTRQIVEDLQVTPDISRIVWVSTLDVTMVPVWGRARILGRPRPVAVAARVGVAAVGTEDDLEALGQVEDAVARATASQVHPGLNAGLDLRVHVSERSALELRSRRLQYIETLAGSTLEMKRNQLVQLGVSWWPGAVL